MLCSATARGAPATGALAARALSPIKAALSDLREALIATLTDGLHLPGTAVPQKLLGRNVPRPDEVAVRLRQLTPSAPLAARSLPQMFKQTTERTTVSVSCENVRDLLLRVSDPIPSL